MRLPRTLRHNPVTKMWRYLNKTKRVPRQPPGLYMHNPDALSEDGRILVSARIAKDELGAQKMMMTYNATSAWDVMQHIRPRARPSRWLRLIRWLQRAEGSYPYDPFQAWLRRELRGPSQPRFRIPYKFRGVTDKHNDVLK